MVKDTLTQIPIKTPVRYCRDFTIHDADNVLIADVLKPMKLDTSNHDDCHRKGEYIANCINNSAAYRQLESERTDIAERLRDAMFQEWRDTAEWPQSLRKLFDDLMGCSD